MVGLALAALVVVTLILSLAPGPNPPLPPSNLINDSQGIQPTKGPDNQLAKPLINAAPPPAVVYNSEDLRNVFGEQAPLDVKATVGRTVNLESAGLIYRGNSDQRILLESDDQEIHRTIKFQYEKNGSPVGLVVEGGKEVVFRRIKFWIDSDSTPDQAAAALAVRGVKAVTFEKCIFVQNVVKTSSLANKVPLASVLIDPSENAQQVRPIVNFIDCYFDAANQSGGQVAVAINAPATVRVANCAFRPHAAFFSFRPKCKNTMLDIHNCTGFVEMGPAFRFSELASAEVQVQYSVFARPGAGVPERNVTAGLIYLAGSSPVRYKGSHNLYYNLNSLVQIKDQTLITKRDEFEEYLKANKCFDTDLELLDGDANSPLNHPNPLGSNDPLLAFQLKQPYHDKNLGLRSTWAGEMPEPPVAIARATKKIVDADDGGRTLGVFSTIAAALAGAKDGDVIYVKHGANREVVVPPVQLKPGISVTLKPQDGFRPVLILHKDFQEKESSLFKVQKGMLHFQNLEFLLDPEPGYDRRSVVQMGEAAQVKFERCVFALKATNRVELSVATFLDLDKTMKMESSSPGPAKVEFLECFVHGKGDLVALQGCRKLNAEMTNSLVALDGSLLHIDAGIKSMPMNQGVHWKMNRSSIFTTDPIFTFHSKAGTTLTETHAEITYCLLASLSPERDVVEIFRDDKLSKYLRWECEHNYYANFDADKLRDWKERFPEMASDSGKVTFPKLSDEAKRALWDATQDVFTPADPEQVKEYGSRLKSEQRIPPITDES